MFHHKFKKKDLFTLKFTIKPVHRIWRIFDVGPYLDPNKVDQTSTKDAKEDTLNQFSAIEQHSI